MVELLCHAEMAVDEIIDVAGRATIEASERGVLAKLDEDVTTIEPVHYQPHHPTDREEQEADYYR
jgi:hypothetical protein